MLKLDVGGLQGPKQNFIVYCFKSESVSYIIWIKKIFFYLPVITVQSHLSSVNERYLNPSITSPAEVRGWLVGEETIKAGAQGSKHRLAPYSASGLADPGSRGWVIQPHMSEQIRAQREHSAWSHLTEEACFHGNTHRGRRESSVRVIWVGGVANAYRQRKGMQKGRGQRHIKGG